MCKELWLHRHNWDDSYLELNINNDACVSRLVDPEFIPTETNAHGMGWECVTTPLVLEV